MSEGVLSKGEMKVTPQLILITPETVLAGG